MTTATVVILVIACRRDADDASRKVIEHWVGRKIEVPSQLSAQIMGIPVTSPSNDADFTIVTYIDSAECTACAMKLPVWQQIINEYQAATDDCTRLEFLMIVCPDGKTDVTQLLQANNFMCPVVIDSLGLFNSRNQLPKGHGHRTFLLDADHKVLALGNPAINPKVRDLYLRTIADQEKVDAKSPVSGVSVLPLGVVACTESPNVVFTLTNRTDSTLTIQQIEPSCGCITAHASSDTMAPGQNIEVKAISAPAQSQAAGQFKQHVDVFFNQTEAPRRLTIYGYNNITPNNLQTNTQKR